MEAVSEFQIIYLRQGLGLEVPMRVPQKGTPPPKFPEKLDSDSLRSMMKLPDVPVGRCE